MWPPSTRTTSPHLRPFTGKRERSRAVFSRAEVPESCCVRKLTGEKDRVEKTPSAGRKNTLARKWLRKRGSGQGSASAWPLPRYHYINTRITGEGDAPKIAGCTGNPPKNGPENRLANWQGSGLHISRIVLALGARLCAWVTLLLWFSYPVPFAERRELCAWLLGAVEDTAVIHRDAPFSVSLSVAYSVSFYF